MLISFFWRRTSAFMTHWLLKNKRQYDIVVVFANTGKERLETLDFVHQCDTQLGFNTVWIEAITHLEPGKGVTAKGCGVMRLHPGKENRLRLLYRNMVFLIWQPQSVQGIESLCYSVLCEASVGKKILHCYWHPG